jgi:hypothetical protein
LEQNRHPLCGSLWCFDPSPVAGTSSLINNLGYVGPSSILTAWGYSLAKVNHLIYFSNHPTHKSLRHFQAKCKVNLFLCRLSLTQLKEICWKLNLDYLTLLPHKLKLKFSQGEHQLPRFNANNFLKLAGTSHPNKNPGLLFHLLSTIHYLISTNNIQMVTKIYSLSEILFSQFSSSKLMKTWKFFSLPHIITRVLGVGTGFDDFWAERLWKIIVV